MANLRMSTLILTRKGYEFRSETDTEVLVHLVDDFRGIMPQADWRQVVAAALHVVKGAYACVFLFQDEPDLLIAARQGSPLILGVGDGEFMLGSDASAIVEHTKDVVYLKEGDMAEVKRKGFKEISYIHAEGFPGTEIKHAAVTLVERFLPIFVVAFRSSPVYADLKESILDLKERKAAIIVLTDEGNTDFDGVASFVIPCPKTSMVLEPLLSVVPLQLLSYHIAQMRGCEIDQPKNLAKSVTVE